LYGIGEKYKFRLKVNNQDIYYTGLILDVDSDSIKIKTIRDEIRILNKAEILDCIELNGGNNGKS